MIFCCFCSTSQHVLSWLNYFFLSIFSVCMILWLCCSVLVYSFEMHISPLVWYMFGRWHCQSVSYLNWCSKVYSTTATTKHAQESALHFTYNKVCTRKCTPLQPQQSMHKKVHSVLAIRKHAQECALYYSHNKVLPESALLRCHNKALWKNALHYRQNNKALWNALHYRHDKALIKNAPYYRHNKAWTRKCLSLQLQQMHAQKVHSTTPSHHNKHKKLTFTNYKM